MEKSRQILTLATVIVLLLGTITQAAAASSSDGAEVMMPRRLLGSNLLAAMQVTDVISPSRHLLRGGTTNTPDKPQTPNVGEVSSARWKLIDKFAKATVQESAPAPAPAGSP